MDCKELMLYPKVRDYKQEAINYSIKYQILSIFTAFLCVGEKLVDEAYQKFLAKPV